MYIDRIEKNVAGVTYTDELHSNVGSGVNELDHDFFKGGLTFVINTAAGGAGTQLTEGVDYTLSNINATLTAEAGVNVYRNYTIINATYQTGSLYFSGEYIGDYAEWDDVNYRVRNVKNLAVSADHNITADERYDTYNVTTGVSTITITLDSVATLQDNKFRIRKVDSGSGHVEIVFDGSETAEGISKLYLSEMYDNVVLEGGASEFIIVESNLNGYYHAQDQKSTGTDGGTSVVGRNTRVLNTEPALKPWASLSSNQITLEPGVYRILMSTPIRSSGRTRAYIYDVTSAVDLLRTVNGYSRNIDNDADIYMIDDIFKTAAQKTISIIVYAEIAFATSGLGLKTSDGTTIEVYTDIKIWRLK